MTGLVVGVEQETSIGVLGCVTVRGIVVGGGFFMEHGSLAGCQK